MTQGNIHPTDNLFGNKQRKYISCYQLSEPLKDWLALGTTIEKLVVLFFKFEYKLKKIDLIVLSKVKEFLQVNFTKIVLSFVFGEAQ